MVQTVKKLSYQDHPGEYHWTYEGRLREIWISNPEGDIIGKATNEAYAELICGALRFYESVPLE